MRHLFVVSLALVAALMGSGCLPDVRRDDAPLEAALKRGPQPDADTVFVDSAIIERPADDVFCNQELWEGCNEQCLGLERVALLEENGLRIARIAAPLPSRLQALLHSRRSTTGPRRQRARPDAPVTIAIGPRRAKCTLAVRSTEVRELSFTDAQAQFEMAPVLDEDRRVSLRLTPQIKHGQARVRPRVEETPEGTLRWALDTREPVESLTELSLEFPLEQGEYLIIGSRGKDPGAVGPGFFAYQGDGVPVRQLLIVRAMPVAPGLSIDEEDSRTAPLALQAGYTSARASRR